MRLLFMPALALLAAPAAAEVKSSSLSGFVIEHKATSPLPPAQVYANVGQIARWWNPSHSYSGKAENLSLQLQPGGCFCERLADGGGVEHLRVSYVEPGKRVVLTGALGPLLYEAVNSVMDIQLKPQGSGTEITVGFKAAGFASGNGDKLAGPVDGVVGEQVRRLAALR